jgi:tRNA threonylcarbamoyl adenosine modification protein YeaZ
VNGRAEPGDSRAARNAEDKARVASGALCLGIDACSDLLDLAIVEGARVVAERRAEAATAHCERLLPELASLLEMCGRRLNEIGLVAVTAGPGRFTSLRIGLATAQGLAVGLGVRVVPVSVFDASAHAIASMADASETPRLVVAIDAGPDLQWTLYRSSASANANASASASSASERFERIAGPGISEPEALATHLALRARDAQSADVSIDASAPFLVTGSGASRLAPILSRLAIPHRLIASPNLGRTAALIASERRSAAIDPADLEPLYLRPTQAEERLAHVRANACD